MLTVRGFQERTKRRRGLMRVSLYILLTLVLGYGLRVVWIGIRAWLRAIRRIEVNATAIRNSVILMMTRPRIVCLCGSTRFYKEFQRANYEETMAGRIVLSVGFLHAVGEAHGETWGCTPAQKIALDELHKRKIDLADEVLILNVGGYIGLSTQSELEYAEALGKPIRFLESGKNEREQETAGFRDRNPGV
jgi:hypothetical protein